MPKAGTKATPKITLPSNHLSDDELRVRCAWLYFVSDMNQSDVADQLGITRARVNKLLAEARERNIVTVSVNLKDESAQTLETERQLVEQFGLDFCIVTPMMGLASPIGDEASQEAQRRIARRAVGVAAANFLRGQLHRDGPLTVGVGWGRTLEQMAAHLNSVHKSAARFVSIMGSLTRNSASNPFEVVQTLARRTGGEGHFLPVPFIADSAADLKVFMSQRVVRTTLDLLRQADFIITSMGELQAHSLVLQQHMLTEIEYRSLLAAGAIGDMLGRFFGADGRPVNHVLNRRACAVAPDDIAHVPLVLVVAGVEKATALRALLAARAISALIIDGDAAQALLHPDAKP